MIERYRVKLLGTEARNLGAGERNVLAEIGRKWVYVRPAHQPTGQRCRMKRSKWDKEIAPYAVLISTQQSAGQQDLFFLEQA